MNGSTPRRRRLQVHADTSEALHAEPPVVPDGHMVVEEDTRRFKFGDGQTPYDELPYADPSDAPQTRGGLRAVVLGSSSDDQCWPSYDGNATVANGVLTFVSTQGGHLIADGAQVTFKNNQFPPNAPFRDQRATGKVTRVNATTVTMPVPGWTDGSGIYTMQIHSAHAQPSWWREVCDKLQNRVELVASYAFGGQQTARKLDFYKEIWRRHRPDLVVGAFGIGNDSLAGVSASVTLANIKTMVDYLTRRGAVVLIMLPPATGNMTPIQHARGQDLITGVMELRRKNPRLLLSNEFETSINPLTGAGNPALFREGTIHANHRYAMTNGQTVATRLAPLVGELVERRIASIVDCTRAEATNKQAMEGFWSATGKAANTMTGTPAKVSGVVDKAFTAASATGAGTPLACSLALRSDGVGYDQVLTFTGVAGNKFQLDMKGEAGFEFWRYLSAGTWEPSMGYTIALSGGATVLNYSLYIECTVGGVAARYSEHMRWEGGPATETPLAVNASKEPAYFPRFDLPSAPTDARLVLALELATAGTVTFAMGRPTLRKVS